LDRIVINEYYVVLDSIRE